MATYSVFRQDDGDGEVDPNQGPPLLAYRLRQPVDEAPPADDEPASSRHRESGLPCVVLQLPDLSLSQEATDGWWPRLSNRLFWVGIALGALAALWLIWNPKKETPPPALEEAPSWSGPSQTTPSPTTQAPNIVPAAPAAASAAPANPFAPPISVRTAQAGAPVWDGARAPVGNDSPPAVAPGNAAPAWPGAPPAFQPQSMPPVRPGEAAPTGIQPR